jgi:hypothetical protein
MHFAISGTWGLTDPTKAMMPFIFAASALQDGDSVTLMLIHDAMLMAMEGAGGQADASRSAESLRGGSRASQGDAFGLPALRRCPRPCPFLTRSLDQAWRNE